MQPREPQWDKPGLSGPAALGCALLVAVVAASGVSLWLIRAGKLSSSIFDRRSAATPIATVVPPSTSIEAPATEEASEPTPEPESSPLDSNEIQRSIDAEMQQKIREMDAALEKARNGGREVYRAGGEVTAPVVISRVKPKYPEAARRARVQGVVIVEATVDWEGYVRDVRVLKGLPMGLDAAAKLAVMQWKFEPATRRGEPVDAYTTLTVPFRVE